MVWCCERIAGGYVVKDVTGQALAYVYARETRGDADTAKVLTMDEARRVASNIAKLPTLLSKRPDGFKFAGASDIRALTNNHEEQSRWPDLRSAALVVNGQHKIFAS